MTSTQYKRQAQEIAEILMTFSGKEDDAEKFAMNLLEKYREFGEFNAKALECKNLAEFKNLASANGMNFESDEEANELFFGLSKGKKEVEKAILSAEDMAAVSGGGILPTRQRKSHLIVPAAARRQVSTLDRIQGFAAIGSVAASLLSIIVGTIAGAFNDDATFLDALPYQLFSAAFGVFGVGLLNLPGTVLPGQ